MSSDRRKVLLLGWDAADWQVIHPLLDRGEMPALARLLSEGVMGDVSTLEPVLSPMLWNAIATGFDADRHGILGFTEPDPHTGGVRPSASTSRQVKALWNIAAQSGLRAHVVGWFAGHPAEPLPHGGTVVSDAFARPPVPPGEPWPMLPGTVHPPELTALFDDLRLRPEEVDGETLLLFVPGAREVDQETEGRLATLAKLIAEMASVHNAATWIAEHREWDFLAVYHGAIDHFSHGFMRFHPPCLPWVDERAFNLYSGVVNACYRFHDLMLARMLALAGPECAVVLLSDHGFHSGPGRRRELPPIFAGPALDHRPHGVLVLRGPGLRRDERLDGAGLLDIAPTVLALLGLPAGADMPGRVLAEAWETPPDLARVPSWENVPGDGGQHRGDVELSPADSAALLQQFVDLGYIEAPSGDADAARAACLREQRWNLARVHLAAGRFAEAAPLLEQNRAEVPERGDWALALAHCQARLGLLAEAQETVERIVADSYETPLARALLGQIAFAKGDHDASLAHLLAARAGEPGIPELPLFIGRNLLALGKLPEAEAELRRAVALDADNGIPRQALAETLLRQRRWEDAAEEALRAVNRHFHLPHAHFILGRALARLGVLDRAEQAFQTALAQRPPVWEAHRWLAVLLAGRPGRETDADHHRRLAGETHARREAAEDELARRRRAARARVWEQPPRAAAAAAADGGEVSPAGGAAPAPPLDLLLVSGLPRSGTSLLMQMLAAGGWPILHDGRRAADADNPEGYYEWEKIKGLRAQPDLIREAEGKVVKVVSLLLPALPGRHRYRVIFLRRPIEQVAASQARMIARRRASRGENGGAVHGSPPADPAAMAARLRAHADWTLAHLRNAPNVSLLEVDYPDLVGDPRAWTARIAAFAGRPDPDAATLGKMAAAVAPELFRNRG